MNYVYDALVVLSATESVVINQSKLTSRNVAIEAFSNMMGWCTFTFGNHKIEGQKICSKSDC